jgi:hypothetical protein
LIKNCGKILSRVILSNSHVTHIKLVKTAPLKTKNASMEIKKAKESLQTSFHIWISKVF